MLLPVKPNYNSQQYCLLCSKWCSFFPFFLLFLTQLHDQKNLLNFCMLHHIHKSPIISFCSFFMIFSTQLYLFQHMYNLISISGALFGGFLGGFFLQYGRRKLLTWLSIPFSLSWIWTVFAKSVETMFVTAFIGGFCCSIVSMVTQVRMCHINHTISISKCMWHINRQSGTINN